MCSLDINTTKETIFLNFRKYMFKGYILLTKIFTVFRFLASRETWRRNSKWHLQVNQDWTWVGWQRNGSFCWSEESLDQNMVRNYTPKIVILLCVLFPFFTSLISFRVVFPVGLSFWREKFHTVKYDLFSLIDKFV